MQSQLEGVKEEALRALEPLTDVRALDEWRVQYLGKKSPVTQISRQMGSLTAEQRPVVGGWVNDVRAALQAAFEARKQEVEALLLQARFAAETIDISLPGRRRKRGAVHPLMKVIEEIEDVFLGMGFQIAEGPEVETDTYNFEMLNIPKDHPARDMQDTFYLTEELLLRTHTSPMQVRTMERMRPNAPVKVIVPGRVYRRDEDDATHSHAFTQIEGLVVDEGIRLSDLKGVLLEFARAIFGPDQEVRLRPSFFPFTEPSAEVDVRCINCGGSGCRICKDTGWIEILGSGMVHPRVLDGAGYDSKRFSGFAFGMGPERIAMLKYGIDDIRLLYQNDLRLLCQFNRVM
ncbi:phenylalanine--tRNA ligase subunit alpha [Alicyclobacillus cycloheptanicus]|uniref:phenylalanine--tRNA ligase subunit alpha n=1 Tax=Alicyclobacillus cycloheptanicus TaxID=1457 RepID=UPI00237974AC|nr:phenylalanine--tRNA ligase subunit alpha [Alicyclobacillus cycloheptanicus]WDM03035.1 phenylalanine--tRNA ligase subunit alpha [Alicyclobacillus cycloheptanicus]